MTKDEVMTELKRLGDPAVRERNLRNGASENQFGVKLGDLRPIAKKIKTNTTLARELWATGNLDAMLLATLIVKPKEIPPDELEKMIREITVPQLADWMSAYVVKAHPEKEEQRERWMDSDDVMCGRMGWSLTCGRVSKNPEGLDITALLDRLEREMGDAPYDKQWTMNFCLIDIGVHFPEHRERAIAIGERIGAFRDYPTSKGCVSPFAPIAIPEMAKRQVT